MKAPQVRAFRFFYRREEYNLDPKSREMLDRLYALLSEIEPCGSDERRSVWIRVERGTLEDYGDFDEMLEEGEVESREEFERNWRLDYPDEYDYYELTTLRYQEWRSVFLNGVPVIQINPEKEGWGHDISNFLEWLISEVGTVLDLLRKGEYNSRIRQILPYKYRTGVISAKEYWKLYPDAEASHFERISREECAEFAKTLAEDKTDGEGKPLGRIREMTVNKYLEISKLGYDANKLEGYETMTPLEMYRRYADGRDGGLLGVDPDSPKAFDDWFDIPDKWVIENPSHLWEAVQGSSRTNLHLFVRKDEGGYYLTLSQNEYCCPEEAVRFYVALRKRGIPVSIYGGKTIEKYLSGGGKIGIVPCFNMPWDYYYGGFDDKDVGTFIHLPDEPCGELIRRITWEEIPTVRLNGEG
ncbi:MAG: hypothetical protein ILO68_01160 [Clostridia bacterium]|nr:hypothetical protein [Clostridia bacterium]